ncbi:MAG: hypothetical protein V3V03_00385 [Hyphomonadaceae bacterium]
MDEQDFHDELKAAFAKEDEALEDGHFSRHVMAGIRRARFVRRCVLALAISVGLLAAGSQLPSLLLGLESIGGEGSGLDVAALLDKTREVAGLEPYWLIAGLVCALSVIAAFTQERV